MKATLTALLLAVAATSAHALPTNIKVLARFDIGYAKCESRFPDMRGHGDEAYLALWHAKPGPKRAAELATARKSSKYRKERELALKTMGTDMAKEPSTEKEEKLRRQCEATWSETQRNRPAGK